MPNRALLSRRLAAIAAAVVVPAAVAVSAHQAAAALTGAAAVKNVDVDDNFFAPATVTAVQGDTVRWTWVGINTHTVTDATGIQPVLYESGFKSTGMFSRVFRQAGGYAYRCRVHFSMTGRVNVPIRVSPATGTPSTTFTIRWSTVAAPSGFTHDVQIDRPGAATGFVAWRTTTAASGTFRPDAGRGTYRFRARLRKVGDGSSAFSPVRSITVS